METGYSINYTLWGKAFPVPADIVDKHLKLCSGVALKCLLLILRSPEEAGDIQSIAKRLGQPVSEIADALNYWEENGILCLDGKLPAAPQNAAAAAIAPQPRKAETAVPQIAAASASRPHFPREEAVSLIDKDTTLTSLMHELQAILGKPLTSADTEVLLALYSFYGLSAHYILSLVHYCVTIGKHGMAYAEKVAAAWIADGIDDSLIDSHIDRMTQRLTNEGRIRKAFGIGERSLTTREKEYIAAWFDSYGFDLDMIQYAYEITVDRTGKTAFGYLNKILQDWNQKGFKTLSQAKGEAQEKKRGQSSGSAAQSELDRKILEQFMKD